MSKAIQEYMEALQRLKNNEPIRLTKGCEINNDTVALEAGRKRGSIKKSRTSFASLIQEIELAKKSESKRSVKEKARIKRLEAKLNDTKLGYEKALAREILLIEKIVELEKRLSKFDNIVSFEK